MNHRQSTGSPSPEFHFGILRLLRHFIEFLLYYFLCTNSLSCEDWVACGLNVSCHRDTSWHPGIQSTWLAIALETNLSVKGLFSFKDFRSARSLLLKKRETLLALENSFPSRLLKLLIHAFVSNKIDHCNSLLYGLPKNLLKIASIRTKCCRSPYHFVSQVRSHYSHPHRSSWVTSCRTHKVQNTHSYFQSSSWSSSCLHHSVTWLHATFHKELFVHHLNSFSPTLPIIYSPIVIAPSPLPLLNSGTPYPQAFDLPPSLFTFKSRLKTHLFKSVFK